MFCGHSGEIVGGTVSNDKLHIFPKTPTYEKFVISLGDNSFLEVKVYFDLPYFRHDKTPRNIYYLETDDLSLQKPSTVILNRHRNKETSCECEAVVSVIQSAQQPCPGHGPRGDGADVRSQEYNHTHTWIWGN